MTGEDIYGLRVCGGLGRLAFEAVNPIGLSYRWRGSNVVCRVAINVHERIDLDSRPRNRGLVERNSASELV